MNAEALCTTREAAALLGLSHRTLQRWRYERRGPRHYRVGGAVRYRRGDLLAFLDESEVGYGVDGVGEDQR